MWTDFFSSLSLASSLTTNSQIRQRMAVLAEEEGLERVEDSAPEYLQAALHFHLLRILRGAPPVRSQPVEESFLTLAQPGRKRDREGLGEGDLIEASSLVIAAQRSGKKLLRDDLPVQREKILLYASQ